MSFRVSGQPAPVVRRCTHGWYSQSSLLPKSLISAFANCDCNEHLDCDGWGMGTRKTHFTNSLQARCSGVRCGLEAGIYTQSCRMKATA